jgi:hypothetical protein
MSPFTKFDVVDMLAGLVCGALFLAGYIGIGAWAVSDAQRRGQSGGLIVILFYLFGPFSALIWLIVRPRKRLAERAPVEYTNAEDALAAATRLDMLGDWDRALAVYENAAKQWPEHQPYIKQCVAQIHKKQAQA